MWLRNFATVAKLQGCEVYSGTPYCRNLTQTAKINIGKKNAIKMKNKLETKINLKIEKI